MFAAKGKRLAQLEKGFDIQTSLYRLMLVQDDDSDQEMSHPEVLGKLWDIGVAYFTLNDGRAVAAYVPDGSLAGGDIEIVPGDVSREAMPRVLSRLRMIRSGQVELNLTGDEKWFTDQASITPYALDVSPLIRYFMVPGEVEP